MLTLNENMGFVPFIQTPVIPARTRIKMKIPEAGTEPSWLFLSACIVTRDERRREDILTESYTFASNVGLDSKRIPGTLRY